MDGLIEIAELFYFACKADLPEAESSEAIFDPLPKFKVKAKHSETPREKVGTP